jgi:2,5-diketo-D-gluconate reductase A
VTLNDGRRIPQLGLGVWQVPDDEATAAVRAALDVGYRLVDTAAIYGNEAGVGRGLRESAVPRDEVIVTTKVWNTEHGYDRTIAACRTSLGRLGLDYIDLYLIHWPVPAKDRYVDTWRALVALRDEGLVRSVGVSNFTAAHLARLVEETGVVPAVNQVELHPRLQQAGLRAAHARLGVATEAWSPLAQGELLSDPTVCGLAARLGVTAAQVVLRWHVQLGNVVIPKSVRPARIAENIDLFGFALSDEDMAAMVGLDRGTRLGPDPDSF